MTVTADPLAIENRPLHEQERWLLRVAAGPRLSVEENRAAVAADHALKTLRLYRTAFSDFMVACLPLPGAK